MTEIQEITERLNQMADGFESDLKRMGKVPAPETIESILWEWAENLDDWDVSKVIRDLRHLIIEEYLEQRRKQLNSGNE